MRYELKQALVAGTLSFSENIRLGALGEPSKSLLFERPLFDERELILEPPAVDLVLDIRQRFRGYGCPLQQVIDKLFTVCVMGHQ
jgi:hypothetical protein